MKIFKSSSTLSLHLIPHILNSMDILLLQKFNPPKPMIWYYMSIYSRYFNKGLENSWIKMWTVSKYCIWIWGRGEKIQWTGSICQEWGWNGKSAWEIAEAIYHLKEIVGRIYHLRTPLTSSWTCVEFIQQKNVLNCFVWVWKI